MVGFKAFTFKGKKTAAKGGTMRKNMTQHQWPVPILVAAAAWALIGGLPTERQTHA